MMRKQGLVELSVQLSYRDLAGYAHGIEDGLFWRLYAICCIGSRNSSRRVGCLILVSVITVSLFSSIILINFGFISGLLRIFLVYFTLNYLSYPIENFFCGFKSFLIFLFIYWLKVPRITGTDSVCGERT